MDKISWKNELKDNENLDAFFDHISLKSDATKATYLWILKGIIDFYGYSYSEFDPKCIIQKEYKRLIREKANKNKKSTLNLFSKIFNILSDIYDLNIKIDLIRETDKFTDYVTFEELHKIIDKADKEIAAVAAFLFCTGLRPISVVSIQKEQLMLSAAHPYVRNVYLKGGKRYDVVILYPNIVLPLLRWYLQFKSQKIENYDKIPYVFISQQLKSQSTAYIYFLIRRCREVLGRPVSPRMFRKGLGIHTKELGWQDNVRKMLLGHSDITTTIKAYSDYNINDIVREFNQKGSPDPQNQQQYFQSQFSNNQFVNNHAPVQNGEFCPFCKRSVDQEMILCPWCGKEIKRICNTCKRYINASWKICPYCGTEVHKKRKYDYAL